MPAVDRPTLRTDRLRLVPLAEEHLELEVELDSDPEVMRHLLGRARSRDEVQQAHRGRLAAAELVHGLGFWVGFTEQGFVGWWLLEPSVGSGGKVVTGEAELGYRLLRRWWRRGLAREGSAELLRHGFADLGLDRIFARTVVANTGSRAVLRSVGMTEVRIVHPERDDSGDPRPGAEQGEVDYAIGRSDWLGTVSTR